MPPRDTRTVSDVDRERKRKRKRPATTTTPSPDRSGAGPSVVLAPGARIAERVIRDQAPPPQPSPDVRDRAETTQKRNVRRGARMTGGPGTKEIESAIRLASRVRAGKASVLQLQTQLRRAGFDISLDGKWGPQTEAAFRTFAGRLARAEVESAVVSPMISFDASLDQRERGRLSAKEEEIHASMQAWAAEQMKDVHYGRTTRSPGEWLVDAILDRDERPLVRVHAQGDDALMRMAGKLSPGRIGLPDQFSMRGHFADELEEQIANAPDGTWLSRIRTNRELGKPDLEGLPKDVQRKIVLMNPEVEMSGFAPPPEAVSAFIGLADRFVQDVYQSSVGAPAGMAMAAADPIGTIKTLWQDYKYRYGPLFEGKWGEFAKRQAEHPLFAVLDVASVLNVGLNAPRLARRGKATAAVIRELKTGTGFVQIYQPGSALGRAIQDRMDALAQKYPEAPFVGANARGASALRRRADRTHDEIKAITVRFQRAAKRLNGHERVAFDVIARVGPDDAAAWLELETNARWFEANNPENPRHIRTAQKAQHVALRAASAYVLQPNEKILRALALGRELTEGDGISTESMKLELGMIDPGTAARRKDLTKQLFGEYPSVGEMKSRAAIYRQLREHAPQALAQSQMRLFDAMAHHWSREHGQPPEQFYAQNISALRAEIPGEDELNALPEGIDVLYQAEDEADWSIPEDVEAWVRAGQPDPERAPGDMEGLADESDIPFEAPPPAAPVSMRPGEPRMPTMRRIPGESDEDFQRRSDAAYADYQMRLAAWQATDPDAGTSGLTIPEEWDEDMLAQLEPSPDDYEVQELQVAGRRQWHVRQKGRKGWIIFHQKEGAEGVDHFIREQVKRRKYLLENHPDFYYQRAAKFNLTVNPGGGVIRGVVRSDVEPGKLAMGLSPEHANASTPIHEMGHMVRRFLAPESMKRLEEILGVPDGVWKVEHEEKFATMVEAYFWHGEAPNYQLRPLFAEMRAAMREVYGDNHSPGTLPIAQKQRLFGFLDEVFNPLLKYKAGDGVIFMADVASWRARGSITGRRKSLKLAKTAQMKNRGILQAQGRHQRGPKVLLNEFLRTARLYANQISVKELIDFAAPVDFDNHHLTGGVAPGWGLFNPHGAEVPRSIRETPTTDDFLGKFPHEFANELRQQKDAFYAEAFPDDISKIPEEYRDQAMQLPLEIIEAFTGDRVSIRMARSPYMDKLAATLDVTNALVKAATIYGKLSYIPLNIAGNVVFLSIAAGPFAGPALVRASRGLGGLDPELLAKIDFQVGEGAAAALALEERNAFVRTVNKLAYAQSAVADRVPRRAAWIYFAAKQGFISEAAIRRLLEGGDDVWRDGVTYKQALFQVSEQAERAMVQFRGMSPFQQEVISRTVFIYGWLRGATKYGLHSAIERPIRTNIIAQLGQEEWDRLQEVFGKLVSYIDGITPVGKVQEMLGVETVPVRSTQAINPVSTAGEALAAIYNAAKGDMKEAGPVISDYLSPAIKTPIEFATGYNIFFGEQYDNRWEAVYGQPMRWPAIKIGRQLISPEITDGDVADQPIERQPNFIIPSKGAARREALEELFLGSARKRNLNFKAAAARGREQRGEPKAYEDYREELIDTLEEAGMGRPPEVVLEELRKEVALDADPRLDRGTTYKEKLAATAEVAGFEAPTDITEAAAERMYLDLRRELFKNLHAWENQADKIIDANLEG